MLKGQVFWGRGESRGFLPLALFVFFFSFALEASRSAGSRDQVWAPPWLQSDQSDCRTLEPS